MKKLLLAATVATLSVSAAQAAPTLYGKLNVTVDQVDNSKFDGKNVTEVNSNASRLGVKGEEKLTEKVSAVYQAEWEVATDGGTTDWKMRNRFLGLKFADIGTLKAGNYDSYFKTAAGNNQDIFNDHNHLDMTNMLYGEDRLSNSIGFETDKKLLGGLQFSIMAQQGEDSATDNNTKGQTGTRNGFGDSISTSLSYDNKDYGVAAAIAGNFGVAGKYNAHNLKDIYSDAIRVTGSVDLSKAGVNGLVFGALWQTAQPTDDTVPTKKGLQEDAYGVTAAYAIPSTPWKLKAEYLSANTSVDNETDRQIDQYGVGVDYNLNKQARFYGVVGQQQRDWLTKDDKKTVIGLGMEYNF
jgi:predicted porin